MKHRFLNCLALVTLAAFLGCSDPADNVPEAVVTEVVKTTPNESATVGETPSPAPSAVAGKTYVISADSKIDFLASKAVGGETPGGFKKFIGQLNVVDGKLAAEGSKIVIDMESTWTNNEKLTAHLKNADFFDVPKFPTTTFEATRIESANDDYQITGNLTMHGVTKSVTIPAKVQIADEKIMFNSASSINRFDFDMKFEGQKDNMIRDRVTLTFNVTATPGAADFSSLVK